MKEFQQKLLTVMGTGEYLNTYIAPTAVCYRSMGGGGVNKRKPRSLNCDVASPSLNARTLLHESQRDPLPTQTAPDEQPVVVSLPRWHHLSSSKSKLPS